MATAIYVPRINNNDDEVKVLAFDVRIGDKVQTDQIVGQVETDKAVLDVTASSAGYVLGFVAKAEEVVRVGSVMLWLGGAMTNQSRNLRMFQSGRPLLAILRSRPRLVCCFKNAGCRPTSLLQLMEE